ncbi:hypothetical protein BKA70DRAFT_193521 [Coprinopsis sp. MPI-PUGE-AT-0042]|nr:hypothetical protein BKA70DRAFT_193521 [Coprinopsis sp. MPI-PUGE-AT-0042]
MPSNDSSVDAYQNAANRCICRRSIGGSVIALAISGAPKQASGGCKRAGALRSLPVRWLGTRRKGLGKQNMRLMNSSQHQTSYRRSTQSRFSIPLSSCITTAMCMIPVRSSVNAYGGLPNHLLHPLSVFNSPPECPIHLYYTLPTPLCPHPRTGTAKPTLHRARSTKSGSRELKKLMHALPLFDELLELLARHDRSNDRPREVQVPIHVRYAEPRGEDLMLPFEGPRAFFSCDYDARGQDPWFLVTRHLDSDSPDAQRLKIHVPVGDRQVGLQVVGFGTALSILLCSVWVGLGA